MTRATLRSLVIENTRRSDKVSLINSAIDLGLMEISQVQDFRKNRVETESTLSEGSRTITLPSDFFQMIRVRVVDPVSTLMGNEVELRDKGWVLQKFPTLNGTLTGRPTICFVDDEDGTLVFQNLASQDWTIKYEYFKQYTVASDGDVIPAGLENALSAWVTSYVFSSIQMYTDANQWQGIYQRALKLAVLADRRTRSKKTLQPPGFGGPLYSGDAANDPFMRTNSEET